jgi:uncharacterized membrane protein
MASTPSPAGDRPAAASPGLPPHPIARGGDDHDPAPHVRRLRQRALGNRLRESLLFLPVVLLIGGVLLEEAARAIDRNVDVSWLPTAHMAPDAAQTLLSTIAGATITTAGVVFSLLVVSLQLASGQFSPRVLRTFWRDRAGQVLIGLLLATFAFCVLTLSQLNASADHAPAASMAVSIALALASILAIVGYLNRITRSQYVGRIMERIQGEGLALVRELPYGTRVGERYGEPVAPPELDHLGPPLVVAAHTNGWVQQISRRAVLAATAPGSVVRLDTRVGAYLVRGEAVASIWPKPEPSVADRVVRLIAEALIVGPSRTMQQDIDFALRQLNDIGLRALSPAVNDPTTAIEVVLRVSSVMRPLLVSDLPDQSVRDPEGRVLLTPWDLSHPEYVHHAYGQVRAYGATHAQVILALVRALRMLRDAASACHGDRTETIAALDAEIAATVEGATAAGLPAVDLDTARSLAYPLGAEPPSTVPPGTEPPSTEPSIGTGRQPPNATGRRPPNATGRQQ